MPEGSDIFKGIIDGARQQLLLDHRKSAQFANSGIKGDERAAALIKFFKQRIPDVFEITKGEVIDCFDNRTGQLDIIVYDKLASSPISQQEENSIIPCESVYAIIEVKSVLNKEEIKKCLRASELIRNLRPFKHRFVDAREGGAPANEEAHRCFYLVFAYDSDLSADNWLKKEFDRLNLVASENNFRASTIDRVFVADRGIINPTRQQGKVVDGNPEYLFAELFLHVINFIQREKDRRPQINWQSYALPKSRGWRRI
jgi:hypothetical protein